MPYSKEAFKEIAGKHCGRSPGVSVSVSGLLLPVLLKQATSRSWGRFSVSSAMNVLAISKLRSKSKSAGQLLRSSNKRFYEKVIKVKADVAAVLKLFFSSCIGPPAGDLGSCQGRRRMGAFILTLDSSPSHLQSSSERKRNAVQLSFVP